MISSQLLHKVAKAHAQYEVDSMSLDELKSAAMDSRLSEMFNAAGSIDRENLLENLLQRFDGDTDAMREYMVEQGVSDSDAETAIAEFMA
jgi:hypothetical protein